MDGNTKEQKSKSSYLPQIVATLAACIGSFSLGTVVAWTSPVLPYLSNCTLDTLTKEQNAVECSLTFLLTDSEQSLVKGLFPLGALVAGQVTGIMISYLGPKITMISMSLPCIVGWILLMIMYPVQIDSVVPIYFGRFLTGFGAGAFTLAVPMYVSEIAESSIRGALSSCMQLSCTIGIAFINALAIDEAVSWPVITYISIAFPILMGVSMIFMPESPYYLLTKNKDDGARKSLRWLRGQDFNIEKEIDELKVTQQDQIKVGSVSYKQLLTTGVYLKPLTMALMLMFFQQFSGINAVLFSLQDIFDQVGEEEIVAKGFSAFLVALVQVIATGIAVMIVDRFGRRILLISSAFVMSLSLVGLGVFFYIADKDCKTDCFSQETIDTLSFLPLVSLLVYIFFFSIGFGPLAWTINAEICTLESKSKATSLATTFNWLCAFIVTYTQDPLKDAITIYGVYFMYASICAVAVAYIIIILPETKGKSNDEMKAYFLGQKSNKVKAVTSNEQTSKGTENEAFD